MTRVRSVVAVLGIAACSGRSTKLTGTPSTTAAAPQTAGTVGEAAAPAGPPAPGSVTPTVNAAPAARPAAGSAAGAASTPAPAQPGATPAATVTLADVGLEALSLDRTADPCVDFYQFACGGWLQSHPIPADRAQWGRSDEVDDHNKAAIKALLDDAAKATGGDPATRKLGDFYASCMDEAAIERAGTGALKPLLAKVGGVKDARTWLAALVELHKLGIFVVGTTTCSPTSRARRAMSQKREIAAAYNPTDMKALGKQVKSVDWPAYFKALWASPSKKLIVGTPAAFAAFDQLRARFKPAQWASYFSYHLLSGVAYALPRAFDDEAFQLQKLVTGALAPREAASGALRNMTEFADAFRCAPGTPMRPARTCTVW